MTSDALLQADHLRRVTDGGSVLLQDVSLAISAGSTIAIVGPPGSGKTLLLRSLALLDPLQAGTVRFRGRMIPDADVPGFRRQVLLVAQRPVLVEGTVRENLQLPYELGTASAGRFDEPRIAELLAAVDRLPAFLDRQTSDLSGGELQIVSLLRAVQLDPVLLLLDEPTSSLDDVTTAAVETLVGHWLSADPERSLVIVSHTKTQVARLAERIVRIEGGAIITDEENVREPA